LILAYWPHVETHYRHEDGTPTNEVKEIRYTLKALRELFVTLPSVEFGPLKLKAVREHMIRLGWCRGVINRRIDRIKRMFRWAVENEQVPPSVYHGLQAVRGLQRGRTEARESEPIQPVADQNVDAVLPFVLPEVAAMVEVQRLTGMRPGEVCKLRGG